MIKQKGFMVTDAYESMFGKETTTEAEHFMPNILPLTINNSLIEKVMEKAKKEKSFMVL